MPTATQKLGATKRTDLLSYRPEDLVIVLDEDHCLYDPRALDKPDERLIQSIMEVGILEPVIVRKNGAVDGVAVIEVIAGRQRVNAARIANKRLRDKGLDPILVPARRIDMPDKQAHEAMLLENEIRRDDDAVVRAKKISHYLTNVGDMKSASIVFGLARPMLTAYQALAVSEPCVQRAVLDGLPIKDVLKLRDLSSSEQRALIQKLYDRKILGLAEGAIEIDKARKEKAPKNAAAPRKRYTRSAKVLLSLRDKIEEAASRLPDESPEAYEAKAMMDALVWATGGGDSDFEGRLAALGIKLDDDGAETANDNP